uniref:G-patch domain-containing protein n=1 Tax=Kalmanozyma brasiliensis (strain GHG001) TaxID=1365824 RepID=V5ETG8_KALBG
MATDRLRRNQRALSPDTLSTLTTSLCVIGTPLPSLSSAKKDQDEHKPIWQQEARDAQGRRRFHGAFTGGWSAGYFNTVGSKEGWTPGSFRSSRKDKGRAEEMKVVGGRVEDFMDEEDLDDWKQVQRVEARRGEEVGLNQIAGLRGGEKAKGDSLDVDGGGDEELGYKLLRKMGWKEGEEMGSRVDEKKKGRRTRKGLGYQDAPTLAQTLSKTHEAEQTTGAVAQAASEDEEDVWSDGRPVLSGFHLARQPLPPEPSFPASPVPPGWQPDPNRVWSRYDPQLDSKTTVMTPSTRGQLLGEAKIPGPPPNIAAFLSAKAQERLAAQSNAALPSSASLPSLQYVECPRLEAVTAKQALVGFAPFGVDAAKQNRYETYLKGQLEPASERAMRLQVPRELTAEQFSNELREFAKSASMFRPMSAAIASRFAPASAAVMEHETRGTSSTPGLRQPAPASSSTDLPEEPIEPQRQLSTAQQAAKMGNFGHLTRTMETWAPERLLCKRFGVPEPASTRKQRDEGLVTNASSATRPDLNDDPDPFYGSNKVARSKSIRVYQHWERSKEQLKALASAPTPLSLDAGFSSQNASRTSLTSEEASEETTVGLGDDDRQGHDTLTYVKPSIDVYKAIFASDEETSGAEDADLTAKPKMQNPDAGAGVVFQARSKRKDAEHDGGKGAAAQTQGEKKRKKDKAAKKALLTFDFDDGDADEGAMEKPSGTAKSKVKARVKASDLF